MTLRLSGHFPIFGLVFFVLSPLLGISKQRSREKFAIFILKPWSPVRILIYRTWAITQTPGDSLRDRQSKGKGKGIWAQDGANFGEGPLSRAKNLLSLSFQTPAMLPSWKRTARI